MSGAVTILVIVVAAFVAALLFYLVRAMRQSAERALPVESPVAKRPMPIVTEFHVRGDVATTVLAVPLGDGEPSRHLVELLCVAGVEYVRDKVHNGLPLDGVRHIEVSAMRGDNPEVLCTIDLPDVGVLPEPEDKVSVNLVDDPIAAVQEVVADTAVAAPSSDISILEPVHEFVRLSGPTEAHLRSIGVDTDAMSLNDLVLGLLRVSGYDVHVGRSGMSASVGETADIYGLTRNGQSTMLVILRHEPGSHPELEDSALARFAVEVAQSNPAQAILVTDKFSPYSMYEREKRDKRLVCITRERLQAFVDSFGLS